MTPEQWHESRILMLRHAVLHHAASCVGMHEEPMGSNRGILPDTCNNFVGVAMGSPWCASWACWLLHHAGVLNGPRTASSGGIATWGRENNAVVRGAPRFGDLGEVHSSVSPTGFKHTVLIVGGPPHELHTIEGNEGDMVKRRIRSLDELFIVNPYLLG